MGILIFRLLFILILGTAGYYLAPFGLPPYLGALAAFLLGLIIIFLEAQIRKTQFRIIWSSTIGTFLGVGLGWFLGAVYQGVPSDEASSVFIRVFFLLVLPYIGFLVGLRRPEWLSPSHLFRFIKEKSVGRSFKILDTSVIIDGRISDICDTACMEGTLIIPQFVLKELQTVADSPDGVKRQRGRRGLDVQDHLHVAALHVCIRLG
ncbi:MAG: PIN domain nuclease, partial [Candidatus Aminicenantaceae bacterium]